MLPTLLGAGLCAVEGRLAHRSELGDLRALVALPLSLLSDRSMFNRCAGLWRFDPRDSGFDRMAGAQEVVDEGSLLREWLEEGMPDDGEEPRRSAEGEGTRRFISSACERSCPDMSRFFPTYPLMWSLPRPARIEGRVKLLDGVKGVWWEGACCLQASDLRHSVCSVEPAACSGGIH